MPLNPQPLLRGEKVRLTAMTADDLPTLSRWYEDADFVRHFDGTPAAPRQFTTDFLDEIRKSHTDYTFAIRPLDQPEMIGMAGAIAPFPLTPLVWLPCPTPFPRSAR